MREECSGSRRVSQSRRACSSTQRHGLIDHDDMLEIAKSREKKENVKGEKSLPVPDAGSYREQKCRMWHVSIHGAELMIYRLHTPCYKDRDLISDYTENKVQGNTRSS